tara:strand:- start:196 stop:405 length:210 start_codon:yes stop_codon:yes gene_type:complete
MKKGDLVFCSKNYVNTIERNKLMLFKIERSIPVIVIEIFSKKAIILYKTKICLTDKNFLHSKDSKNGNQ